MDSKGFERNFISSYSGWDDVSLMHLQFYDAILVQSIGPFEKNAKVECISLDLENCRGQIFNKDGTSAVEFTINLSLGSVA